MIELVFPEHGDELMHFAPSAVAEAAHSWHVLSSPGHHSLQMPWVRACRDLPKVTRAGLRELSWTVAHHVPAFFEAPLGHPDDQFSTQLERIAALPAATVAHELAESIAGAAGIEPPPAGDERGWDAVEDRLDPPTARRLRSVREHPERQLERITEVLLDYWQAAFAERWHRLEPLLFDAVERAGERLAHGEIIAMLRTLSPSLRVDGPTRTAALDSPHRHRVPVAERGAIMLTPSYFAWPHVRITCDPPWPLRLTYPVVPLQPARRRRPLAGPLLPALRALGADTRLQILTTLLRHPRSTQELAQLLGFSAAAVSGHLAQLRDAGLVTAQRQGYYVVYTADGERLRAVGQAVEHLADEFS